MYHLSIKTIKRSEGRSSTAAIAYRTASKIEDKKTGEIHDYRNKKGVENTNIIAPKNAPSWVYDREKLWNAVEQKETRKNSVVAREFEVAIPSELNKEERENLINEFSKNLVSRHKFVIDYAIHEPDKEGNNKNFHAHIVATTRRVNEENFTEKTRELDQRNSGEVVYWREQWADIANAHLKKSGHDKKIDHRSNQERGISDIPTIHVGHIGTAIERSGGISERAERNREIKELNKINNLLLQTEKLKEQVIFEYLEEDLESKKVPEGVKPEIRKTVKNELEADKTHNTSELERFKTEINLVQYATKFGYKLNRAKSSRNSYQMENGNGQKVVMATNTNGHGIYFSRDNSSSGSIIDFHQAETGQNLGETRKALRAELGITREVGEIHKKPLKAQKSTVGVIKSLATMKSGINEYLLNKREISADTQEDPRFKGVIKTDRRGNAIFPHYDLEGITGYELKNSGFTAFSRGGSKAVWRSTNFNNADTVIITEGAIDALSHAELKKTSKETAYISAGGSMSKEQKELLTKILKNKKVVLAFDNDKKGEEMAKECALRMDNTKRDRPNLNDWNDELKMENHLVQEVPKEHRAETRKIVIENYQEKERNKGGDLEL